MDHGATESMAGIRRIGTATPAGRVTINVHFAGRGRWKVVFADRHRGVTCDSFDDALKVAHLMLARNGHCELIVHDAYQRVISRELGPEAEEDSPVKAARYAETAPAMQRTGRLHGGAHRSSDARSGW